MIRYSPLWAVLLTAVFIISSIIGFYGAGQAQNDPLALPAGPLAADKGYGLTIDLTNDDLVLSETLTKLRQNGLLWLRQPVRWAEIEPNPGQFEWEAFDRVMATVARANDQMAAGEPFKLIVVLETTPGWARPTHSPLTTPPTDISLFGRFARALAKRYGPQLDYYQIWHEPNLSVNWGNSYIDPAGYAGLLREAALNIREADPQALILVAALAPTLENNPLNLNEVAYLEQLYQAKAGPWFDIIAGQAYGFDLDPIMPARPDQLNFRRLELLRRVMLQYGDHETPIWASAFGWNVLPSDWAGQPSPWRTDQDRYDPPALQVKRTIKGLDLARQEWPWLGPMLAIRWDSADLALDDPARGFALSEQPALLAAIRSAAARTGVATAGHYPASHPSGHYSSGWRFSLTQADIPRQPPYTLTIPFEGTRLDLLVNRGPYRGYLWVSIDGQPASSLPQNKRGQSYVVLYDPLRGGELVTLAQNLTPGQHEAVIEAEGGWGQWAIAGWTVYNSPGPLPPQNNLLLANFLAAASGLGLAWQLWPHLAGIFDAAWRFGRKAGRSYLALPDSVQIAVTLALAVTFYFASPGLTLFLLPLFILALLLRPDLGLVLLCFNLSFFLLTKPTPLGNYLPLESTLLLTTLGFCLKQLPTANYQSLITNYQLPLSNLKSKIRNLKSIYWAALSLLGLALLSTLVAPNFGVSMYEWRMLVSESILFYFLVRLGKNYGPRSIANPLHWAWRLVDGLAAGTVLHALIALHLYFFTDQAILAEGVRRVVGPVYSSPNNLALFLDRVWPILLAVTLLPSPAHGSNIRRGLYGIGLLVISLALLLTFSKGALLLGLPAGMVAITVTYLWFQPQRQWRRGIIGWLGWLIISALVWVPLSQTERFRTTFEFDEGSTGFFRIKVWQAALTMFSDYWWLGVGLNNFLYQYRTRYILPEAWQEPNLSHPHNLVLDFATRLGVGGILLLVWLQIAFWRNAWCLYQKLPEPLVLGLIGSMAVFLGHGLVDNSYFLVDLAFIFFLTFGLVQRLTENIKPLNNKS
jgi:O-antigen ligase